MGTLKADARFFRCAIEELARPGFLIQNFTIRRHVGFAQEKASKKNFKHTVADFFFPKCTYLYFAASMKLLVKGFLGRRMIIITFFSSCLNFPHPCSETACVTPLPHFFSMPLFTQRVSIWSRVSRPLYFTAKPVSPCRILAFRAP